MDGNLIIGNDLLVNTHTGILPAGAGMILTKDDTPAPAPLPVQPRPAPPKFLPDILVGGSQVRPRPLTHTCGPLPLCGKIVCNPHSTIRAGLSAGFHEWSKLLVVATVGSKGTDETYGRPRQSLWAPSVRRRLQDGMGWLSIRGCLGNLP